MPAPRTSQSLKWDLHVQILSPVENCHPDQMWMSLGDMPWGPIVRSTSGARQRVGWVRGRRGDAVRGRNPKRVRPSRPAPPHPHPGTQAHNHPPPRGTCLLWLFLLFVSCPNTRLYEGKVEGFGPPTTWRGGGGGIPVSGAPQRAGRSSCVKQASEDLQAWGCGAATEDTGDLGAQCSQEIALLPVSHEVRPGWRPPPSSRELRDGPSSPDLGPGHSGPSERYSSPSPQKP